MQYTRTFSARWFNAVLVVITTIGGLCHMNNAFQPLQMAQMASDNGNYHSYQPPVKTSVLKQLIQGRSGGNGSGQVDIGQGSTSANGGTSRPPTAHAAFAVTAPLSSPTFEQRMRDLVFGKARHRESDRLEHSRTANHQRRPSNVKMIETLQEYKTVVGDEPGRVVAVRFYATYCKACQAVAPMFYRLATLYPDAMFIDVPVTESNASLHQGLGVTSLPYAHIYHPIIGLVILSLA